MSEKEPPRWKPELIQGSRPEKTKPNLDSPEEVRRKLIDLWLSLSKVPPSDLSERLSEENAEYTTMRLRVVSWTDERLLEHLEGADPWTNSPLLTYAVLDETGERVFTLG